MYKVRVNSKTICFQNKEDADNYNDYLKNGLKVVKKEDRTWYFNNGDVLYDVTAPDDFPKKYLLEPKFGEMITNKVVQLKHIFLIDR
jgi:hypothetical protein